jgi:hypothetical protein
MTIALDHVQEGDWDALNRVVDTLRVLVPDAGTRSVGIRFGTSTVTFTAATTSATTAVSHGLGATPVVVFMQEQDTFTRYKASAVGASTFTAQGYNTANVLTTATLTFYWVVIG